MAIELEIRDGDPEWWVSTDIWVTLVPEAGAPSVMPVEGADNYVWARVRNKGADPAPGAAVTFRWAPSGVMNLAATNPIGVRTLDLAGGQEATVMCPTPWVPNFDGHACLLVAVSHAADPLPAAGVVDVVGDRHYAQRNVTVLPGARKRSVSGLFQVPNLGTDPQAFFLRVQPGELGDLNDDLWDQLALPRHLRLARGRVTHAGLVDRRLTWPTVRDLDAAHDEVELLVQPQRAGAVRFAAAIDGDAAVLHVTAYVEGRDHAVGGVTYLLLADPLGPLDEIRPRPRPPAGPGRPPVRPPVRPRPGIDDVRPPVPRVPGSRPPRQPL